VSACPHCGEPRQTTVCKACFTRDPVDADALAKERSSALTFYVGEGMATPEQAFTCDGCGFAPRCLFAFDLYNTNGDCLADK
jgi:hypothetical protein